MFFWGHLMKAGSAILVPKHWLGTIRLIICSPCNNLSTDKGSECSSNEGHTLNYCNSRCPIVTPGIFRSKLDCWLVAAFVNLNSCYLNKVENKWMESTSSLFDDQYCDTVKHSRIETTHYTGLLQVKFGQDFFRVWKCQKPKPAEIVGELLFNHARLKIHL